VGTGQRAISNAHEAALRIDLLRYPPYRPEMDRRRFLLTALAGTLTAPLAAEAQQTRGMARVGILVPTAPAPATQNPASGITRDLSRRMHELGWVEGGTVAFEARFADDRPDRLAGLAADLVRLNVDVIVAVSPPAIRAAKDATRTIPVVMAFSGIDPVKAGFVASLARPGGNVTGLTILATDMAVKRLELLKEALPRARRVVVIVNPKNASTVEQLGALRAAAPALGMQVQPVEVSREYADAFAAIARERPDAVIVPSDPEFFRERRALVDLAAQARTPASYEWREFVEVGGLMSYGSSFGDSAARVAVYVDKILRGAKPADLPVEQPSKFELLINLKTARALGLTIPPSLLLRADQVIE
jgi:putative ABC transport system substrate-binding protein